MVSRKHRSKKRNDSIALEDIPDSSESDEEITLSNSRDYAIVNSLYPEQLNPKKSKLKKQKELIYLTLLFIMIENPLFDGLLNTAFPISNSWLMHLVIKTGIFFILGYCIFSMKD